MNTLTGTWVYHFKYTMTDASNITGELYYTETLTVNETTCSLLKSSSLWASDINATANCIIDTVSHTITVYNSSDPSILADVVSPYITLSNAIEFETAFPDEFFYDRT